MFDREISFWEIGVAVLLLCGVIAGTYNLYKAPNEDLQPQYTSGDAVAFKLHPDECALVKEAQWSGPKQQYFYTVRHSLQSTDLVREDMLVNCQPKTALQEQRMEFQTVSQQTINQIIGER